jgi:hypothetical protein
MCERCTYAVAERPANRDLAGEHGHDRNREVGVTHPDLDVHATGLDQQEARLNARWRAARVQREVDTVAETQLRLHCLGVPRRVRRRALAVMLRDGCPCVRCGVALRERKARRHDIACDRTACTQRTGGREREQADRAGAEDDDALCRPQLADACERVDADRKRLDLRPRQPRTRV